MFKIARNLGLAVAILCIVFVGVGTLYSLIEDRQHPSAPAQAAAASQPVGALPKATSPAANAHEGVAIEAIGSPVAIGATAFISIQTNAGSACTIEVTYNNAVSHAPGLGQQIADDYGSAEWTWTIAPGTPIGTWPVKVTCVYHGKSAVVDGSLQVTR